MIAISSFSIFADETKKNSAFDAFVESASKRSWHNNDLDTEKTKVEMDKKPTEEKDKKPTKGSKNSAFDAFVESASQRKF